MSKLLNKKEPPLIMKGIFPDAPGETAPLFQDGFNVLFDAAAVKPFPGFQPLFVPNVGAAPVLGMRSQLVSGLPTLFWGDLTKLYSYDETNGVQTLGTGYALAPTPTASSRGQRWSLENWGNWTLAANGSGAIQIRKTGNFGNLSGTPPTDVKILVRRDPFMMALNTDQGGAAYEWCDDGNVEDWVPTTSNFAGANELRDVSSDIIAAIDFAGEIVAFTDDSAHFIQYVGPPFVFGAQKVLTGIGAVGKHAVCAVGNVIYGMSKRGIWVSDLTQHRYIDTPALRNWLYARVNLDWLGHVVAWHDKTNECVIFFLPCKTNLWPNKGIIYSYRNQNWSRLNFGVTAADNNTAFNYQLVGFQNGFIMQQAIEVVPFSSAPSVSMQVKETVQIKAGYGSGGYGNGWYGGTNI